MDNTILLLHCEDFTDSSTLSPKTIANYGGNIVDNGKFKKGMLLSSNSYLLSNATIDPSRDFTIDWWEYSTGTTNADSCLCSNRNTNLTQFQQGILIGYNGTQLYTGSDAKKLYGFTGATIKDKVDNVWVHWALVKKGTNWTTYKNGVKYWSATSSVVPAAPKGFIIGGWLAANTTNYIGYNAIIDEFRISNIARWEDNFEVPQRPYNLIPKLILEQYTKSNIKFSVTYDETINKVDVFVNDIKLKTYTSNFNNLDFAIDVNNDAYKTGKNEIKILITYDNSKTIDTCINHDIHIMPNASLKEVIDKFEDMLSKDFSRINIITATELPTNGKEGQVCIITEHEPNVIHMGFNEPVLNEKDIYIEMDKGDPFKEFKISSSNKVLSVRLKSVVQMQGGVKTNLNGYIMENGTWVSLEVKMYLYKEGIGDITDVTGGYISQVSKASSSSTATVQISSYYLRVYTHDRYSTIATTACALTKNLVDVTDFSKLKAIVKYDCTHTSSTVSSNLYARLGFSENTANNNKFVKNISFGLSSQQNSLKHEVELDISDLFGEYYFKAFASSIDVSSELIVYDAWLE